MADRTDILRLRNKNMFAGRPWLDNALPHSPKQEDVSKTGLIAVGILSVIILALILVSAAPVAV